MASRVIEYILQVADRGSGTLSKVTRESKATASGISAVTKESKALDAAGKTVSGSLGNLRKRLDELKKQKEWIDPKNINHLKSANREIEDLEKKITKLDKTGTRSGGIRSLMSDLGGGVGRFITNPLTIATTALGYGGKQAMSFDEGMAKINITARLDPTARKQLERDIKDIADRNKFDVTLAPAAFEQIISQVEDVELTKEIFEQTIRGSKAGFTDLSTVAGALAQSLSIIGKDNTSAGEILDTFFTSKRVGAGEFADFARYMPGLIASADALGVKYKEVAGLFAYMTGKGQSAEKASVLLDNMFSMMGRGDIVSEMNAKGIATHDKSGKILPFVDIFGSMNSKMGSMSDRDRSQFLEDIGINRMEAKKAFMVMIADNEKLARSLDEVANSAGATDEALEYSRNSVQQAGEVWGLFKGKMVDLGTSILPAVTSGLTVLGGAIDVVAAIVSGAANFFGGWYDELADGNPIVWGLTAALGAAGILLLAHTVKLKLVALWNTIATATSGALSAALNGLKASMLGSGWGIALVGITALVAGIAALVTKTDAATKSFAKFNSETNQAKGEAKGYFTAAMNAAEGSDARATAIKKINEQYGPYLASLLTEKSSNDDLKTALDLVNVELERKFKLKYKNQMIEGASNSLYDQESKLYDKMLKGVDDPDQQQEIAQKVAEFMPRLQSGDLDFYEIVNQLSLIRRAVTKDNWSIGYAPVSDYIGAFNAYNRDLALADTRYGGTQSTGTSNALAAATPDPAGTTTTTTTTGTGTGTGKGYGKGGGSSKSEWIDLDKVDGIDEKGSSTYGAIMSKIGKVQLAGLAASVALAAGVLHENPVPDGIPQGTTMPSLVGDDTNYDDRHKTLSLDKFCDKIEIHIENADGKGYDQIRREIIEVLKEVADGRV